jgi:hypothetical protein
MIDTENYKEIPYTSQIDWENGNVWLNNHITKEKIVITPKVFESIKNSFELIKHKDYLFKDRR